MNTMCIEEVEGSSSRQPCAIISLASEQMRVGAIEILSEEDRGQHARSLSDQELLSKVERSFRNWRENLPYLREARDRFAKPGQRVPVPDNPTWTKWVEEHLGLGIRRVQQLLAEPKPPKPKALKPLPSGPSNIEDLSEMILEPARKFFNDSRAKDPKQFKQELRSFIANLVFGITRDDAESPEITVLIRFPGESRDESD
jgi:hypothetical protein